MCVYWGPWSVWSDSQMWICTFIWILIISLWMVSKNLQLQLWSQSMMNQLKTLHISQYHATINKTGNKYYPPVNIGMRCCHSQVMVSHPGYNNNNNTTSNITRCNSLIGAGTLLLKQSVHRVTHSHDLYDKPRWDTFRKYIVFIV